MRCVVTVELVYVYHVRECIITSKTVASALNDSLTIGICLPRWEICQYSFISARTALGLRFAFCHFHPSQEWHTRLVCWLVASNYNVGKTKKSLLGFRGDDLESFGPGQYGGDLEAVAKINQQFGGLKLEDRNLRDALLYCNRSYRARRVISFSEFSCVWLLNSASIIIITIYYIQKDNLSREEEQSFTDFSSFNNASRLKIRTCSRVRLMGRWSVNVKVANTTTSSPSWKLQSH